MHLQRKSRSVLQFSRLTLEIGADSYAIIPLVTDPRRGPQGIQAPETDRRQKHLRHPSHRTRPSVRWPGIPPLGAPQTREFPPGGPDAGLKHDSIPFPAEQY